MIFGSPLLIQMTKLLGIIQKTRTTVLHPQSEIIIERFKKITDRDNARCLIRSHIRDIKPLRVVFSNFSHVHKRFLKNQPATEYLRIVEWRLHQALQLY